MLLVEIKMAANADRSSTQVSEAERSEPDAEIVDGDSGKGIDFFSTGKPLGPQTNPLDPLSDVFSEPVIQVSNEPSAVVSSKTLAELPNKQLADIISEPLVGISNTPLADISTEPPSDISSELPVDISTEPLANISAVPLPDISSELPADISSEPLADIFSEPLYDTSSQPLADILCEPLADILSEPPVDITSEPLADASREPLADISSEPLADPSSQPLADIFNESPFDIFSAPLPDISSEPLTDISSKQFADISSEPLDDTLNEPPIDLDSEPLADISTELTDDISSEPQVNASNEISFEPPASSPSESPVDSSNEPSAGIFDPPVDIAREPILDNFSEASEDVSSTEPDEISNELLADIPSEPPVSISNDNIAKDPPVCVSSEQSGEISNDPLAEIFIEPEVDISSELLADISVKTPADMTSEPLADILSEPVVDISCNVLADVSSETPADITDEPLLDISGESSPDICREPLADISCKTPAEISNGPPTAIASSPQVDIFSDPLSDIAEDISNQPQSLAVTSSDPMLGVLRETPTGPTANISSEPTTDILSEAPVDIFSDEGTATNGMPSIVSKALSMQTEEEVQDIFTEATVELSLGGPHNDGTTESNTPSLMSGLISVTPAEAKTQFSIPEEEENRDAFEVNISVTNPEKVGDGMQAYLAYKVSTQTTLPMFHSSSFTVRRRYSDFLGLYEKLTDKHSQNGYIVPPPPEKNIVGMTKLKVGKEDSSSTEFVERRRAALERYLQRVVSHPSLIQDPDVQEFLEKDELPRAVKTHALSAAGFFRMISRATEAISRMTLKMNESDAWFEDKMQYIESEDMQLRKLHTIVSSMVTHRKELSGSTAQFAKSMALLGSSEDNTALSQTLSQLAELEAQVEQLQQNQAISDYAILAELLADYIRLLGALRSCFDQRVRAWQRWQEAQNTLQKRREMEAKLQWANKPDELRLAKDEIVEWESKVSQYEREFERISATVRSEVLRFEKEKAKDFKIQILRYLESLLQSEQKLMTYWEAFLPEAKAIA